MKMRRRYSRPNQALHSNGDGPSRLQSARPVTAAADRWATQAYGG
jgi:hypothetical protein